MKEIPQNKQDYCEAAEEEMRAENRPGELDRPRSTAHAHPL